MYNIYKAYIFCKVYDAEHIIELYTCSPQDMHLKVVVAHKS